MGQAAAQHQWGPKGMEQLAIKASTGATLDRGENVGAGVAESAARERQERTTRAYLSDASDDDSSCSRTRTRKRGGSKVTRAEDFTAAAAARVPQLMLDNGEGKKATEEEISHKGGCQRKTCHRRTRRGHNRGSKNIGGRRTEGEPGYGDDEVSR